MLLILTLQAPTPQNGQTHLNNCLLLPTNCLSVFDHFVGLALEGFIIAVRRIIHGCIRNLK